jgi:zinc/manganese transport system substrate-binding protein
MTTHGMNRALRALMAFLAVGSLAYGASTPQKEARILVAVAVTDVEPIVKAVGGSQVDTVNLFKGCLLRPDLKVESTSQARLALSEAIVWTGFLNESAAISSVLRTMGTTPRKGEEPKWIDVSKGTVRTNLPTSTCGGYVDPAFASGDPYFWLNPENGAIIAHHIAKGLGELRPASRGLFMANADAFQKSLAKDIVRWKADLKALRGRRIFITQSGWQNFSSTGGPDFVAYKGVPGELPSPQTLLLHIKQMKADFIVVDPNTPLEYTEAFREHSNLKVIEVPSSIESIQGASTYSALFDHLVKVLQGQAGL